MNFIRNIFNSPFFTKKQLILLFLKYNFPIRTFGIISSVVFGYYIGYFIKNYYFSFHKTTKQIENVVERIVPYEEKYNQDFDNLKSYDECDIPSETLNQKIASLKYKYKRDLIALEEEYAEMESFYNDDESDDDYDFSDENDAKILLKKIYDLKSLLNNEDQINGNALQECLDNVKSKLMETLQNNFILENTPIGNIVMVYNYKKEGFSYYSDKSISNKYLESVCKKYCIQFKCKILFNDVFINEGKLSNFKFLKNEVKNKNKKNVNLSFRSFKEQYPLF